MTNDECLDNVQELVENYNEKCDGNNKVIAINEDYLDTLCSAMLDYISYGKINAGQYVELNKFKMKYYNNFSIRIPRSMFFVTEKLCDSRFLKSG